MFGCKIETGTGTPLQRTTSRTRLSRRIARPRASSQGQLSSFLERLLFTLLCKQPRGLLNALQDWFTLIIVTKVISSHFDADVFLDAVCHRHILASKTDGSLFRLRANLR